MKKTIIVSIILSITTLTVFSQTKQESIKELFYLMKTESMFDKLVFPFQSVQKDSISKVITSTLMNSFKPIFKKIMYEDMVGIYDKYYTQNEIKDLIKFYKSKTGKKLLNLTPEIQNDIMKIVQTKYLGEFMKNFTFRPKVTTSIDSFFVGIKSKNEIYMCAYRQVRETDKYIKYATDFCNNLLMKIPIDTIDQRDRAFAKSFEKQYNIIAESRQMDSMKLANLLETSKHRYRGKIRETLNNIAWEVFERVSDTKTLQNALHWSGRSLEFSRNSSYILDTYANLLYKLGQKEEAIAKEEEALRFANEKEMKGFTETLRRMKVGEKTWKENMEPIGSDVIYIR